MQWDSRIFVLSWKRSFIFLSRRIPVPETLSVFPREFQAKHVSLSNMQMGSAWFGVEKKGVLMSFTVYLHTIWKE
jgi:hypothetical protein